MGCLDGAGYVAKMFIASLEIIVAVFHLGPKQTIQQFYGQQRLVWHQSCQLRYECNALQDGWPQSRSRVYVVAVRQGLITSERDAWAMADSVREQMQAPSKCGLIDVDSLLFGDDDPHLEKVFQSMLRSKRSSSAISLEKWEQQCISLHLAVSVCQPSPADVVRKSKWFLP